MSDQSWFEQPGDELEDHEYPDEYDDDGDSETYPCPECGAEVYEDAEMCPSCGQFITPGARRQWTGRSTWWLLLGLLGIGAVLWVLVFGGP